jgi:hypothetical protein
VSLDQAPFAGQQAGCIRVRSNTRAQFLRMVEADFFASEKMTEHELEPSISRLWIGRKHDIESCQAEVTLPLDNSSKSGKTTARGNLQDACLV